MDAATLGQGLSEHPQRSVFEVLIVWFGHDVPIFLVKRSELNPERIRLQNHGDRIRDLEQKEAARDDHGQEIKSLREAVDALEAAVNKSAWIPAIVSGLIVSVVAGVTIYLITNL